MPAARDDYLMIVSVVLLIGGLLSFVQHGEACVGGHAIKSLLCCTNCNSPSAKSQCTNCVVSRSIRAFVSVPNHKRQSYWTNRWVLSRLVKTITDNGTETFHSGVAIVINNSLIHKQIQLNVTAINCSSSFVLQISDEQL